MKAVVLLSGGIDSTLCLKLMIDKYGVDNVLAIGFNYSQRHSIELSYARKIAKHFGVSYKAIDVTNIFANNHSKLIGSQSGSTYEVPFRNIILTFIAANQVVNQFKDGEAVICLGITKEDVAYADCSPSCLNSISNTLKIASGNKHVSLVTPLIEATKKDIVSLGSKLNIPFKLTYTCYEGEEVACGICPACVMRKQAFEENGLKDPIKYSDDVTDY